MPRHKRWTCDDCDFTSPSIRSHAAREEHWYFHRTDDDGKLVYLSLKGCVVADPEAHNGYRSVANAVIGDTPRPTGTPTPRRVYPQPQAPRTVIPRDPIISITPYKESPDFDESGAPLGVTEDDRHRAFLRRRMRELRGELSKAGLCVECAGDHSHYPFCSRFAPVPDATVEIERELQDAV